VARTIAWAKARQNLGPWPSPSQLPQRHQASPSVPKRSPPLPRPGPKARFVPTLIPAVQPEGSDASPLLGAVVFTFRSSSGGDDVPASQRRGEGGAGGRRAGPGIHACIRPSSRPFHSTFLIKICKERGPGSEGGGGEPRAEQGSPCAGALPPWSLAHLAQDDPHRGVGLDGEPDGLQRPKGRVHLALCDTLGEGAWRGEHRGEQGGSPGSPTGPQAAMAAPCPPKTRDGLKPSRADIDTLQNVTRRGTKKSAKRNKMGSIWLRITAVQKEMPDGSTVPSGQDPRPRAGLAPAVPARSQPGAVSHFFHFFYFFGNATGRNQTAHRGKLKWQKATRAREFFFYLSILKKTYQNNFLAGTPGLYHAPAGPQGRNRSLLSKGRTSTKRSSGGRRQSGGSTELGCGGRARRRPWWRFFNTTSGE